jgi:hypothetical protein
MGGQWQSTSRGMKIFYGKRNENNELGRGSLYIRESAIKTVQFVRDRVPYVILRGRWFHIIFLNVHAPTEDKADDVKGSLYEKLERIFDKFPK